MRALGTGALGTGDLGTGAFRRHWGLRHLGLRHCYLLSRRPGTFLAWECPWYHLAPPPSPAFGRVREPYVGMHMVPRIRRWALRPLKPWGLRHWGLNPLNVKIILVDVELNTLDVKMLLVDVKMMLVMLILPS